MKSINYLQSTCLIDSFYFQTKHYADYHLAYLLNKGFKHLVSKTYLQTQHTTFAEVCWLVPQHSTADFQSCRKWAFLLHIIVATDYHCDKKKLILTLWIQVVVGNWWIVICRIHNTFLSHMLRDILKRVTATLLNFKWCHW